MLAAIDNLIFLVLVAIAALFKWLANRSNNPSPPNESNETQTPAPRRSIRENTGSDEEQIRKFLEALGQPRGSNVPPPVSPRTDVPPRPVAPVRPPKSAIPIPDIRRRRNEPKPAPPPTAGIPPSIPPQPAPTPRTRPLAPVISRKEDPAFEVHESSRPMGESAAGTMSPATATQTVSVNQLTLAQLLRSSDGLRRAMILREIFGPPRSMQPLELHEV